MMAFEAARIRSMSRQRTAGTPQAESLKGTVRPLVPSNASPTGPWSNDGASPRKRLDASRFASRSGGCDGDGGGPVTDGSYSVQSAVLIRTPQFPWPADGSCQPVGQIWRAGPHDIPAVAREALWLAPPGLIDRGFSAWATRRWAEIGNAFRRYLVRMSTRPTPFGLFASVSLGRVGKRTRLELAPLSEARRVSRLDMEVLAKAAAQLARDGELLWALRFVPNDSLYEVAGSFRYFEAHVDGGGRRYTLEEVDASPYLRLVLDRARGGATGAELVAALRETDREVDRGEAEAFVRELVEAQLLVPEIEPPVTGPDASGALLEGLGEPGRSRPLAVALQRCRSELSAMDREGPGLDPERYGRIQKELEDAGLSVRREHLVQVDLFRPGEVSVGPRVIEEILRAVKTLHRITPAREPEDLVRFRERFTERYGERWVPLAEALDEESGVGFGGAPARGELLEGVPFGEARRPTTTTDVARQTALLSLLERAWREGAVEVELGSEDLERLEVPDPPPLPDAFAVMASLAAEHAAAIDAGRFQVMIKSVGGPSGAGLLGRFCHLDPALERAVRQHLEAEEALHPEAVFAEVVHLPEGRVGNVVLRPVLRGYEIPLLGRSGAPRDRQIPVTDLMLTVRRGRIVLWSRRLDREVVPRLTTAHNYWAAGNLPAYRFFCLLQQQRCASGLRWRWGTLEAARFLPRVRCGRAVLARARWALDEREIRELRSAPAARRAEIAARWRAAWRMPRFVLLAEGDNELLVDLEEPAALEMLSDALKGRRRAELVEMFPGPDELCVEGPDGRYTHELVIPFVRREVRPREEPVILPPPRPAAIRRRFPPGSEWLYVKLYCGQATADRVLVGAVAPLVERLLGEGLIDGWFFIRYADPEHHLRVRLHGSPETLWGVVREVLEEEIARGMAAGLIWRSAYDTYEREVERYGGPAGIEACEAMFRHDSEAVVELLRPGEELPDVAARWRLALVGIARLLADFGFPVARRAELLGRLRDGFASEMGAGRAFRKAVARKLREHRAACETMLEGTARDEALRRAAAVFARRSARWSESVRRLVAADDGKRLAVPLDDLVASLVHMHCNRLLASEQRRHEAVLYDLLAKLYASRLARERAAGGRT